MPCVFNGMRLLDPASRLVLVSCFVFSGSAGASLALTGRRACPSGKFDTPGVGARLGNSRALLASNPIERRGRPRLPLVIAAFSRDCRFPLFRKRISPSRWLLGGFSQVRFSPGLAALKHGEHDPSQIMGRGHDSDLLTVLSAALDSFKVTSRGRRTPHRPKRTAWRRERSRSARSFRGGSDQAG